MDLGFPLWVRVTHLFNILFMSLLIRSGIEILAAHPKLYLNDDTTPGSEWIRFTPKKMPSDRLWTAKDEEESYTAWLALPGGRRLGLGRHWHFFGVLGWLLCGLVYVVGLFVTPEWRRLIPTSWDVFPQAWQAALMYLRLELPPPGNPFNPLQQLAYFSIIFLLAPLQILTALAMSPAVEGRLPWYPALFGGRQLARSLHFLGLVAWVSFVVHHVALVVSHGLGEELAAIVLGVERGATAAQQWQAIGIMGGWLVLVAVVNVWATRVSVREPRRVQQAATTVLDPLERALLRGLASRQHYDPAERSPWPRVNGRPPKNGAYAALMREDFAGYALEVGGLVQESLRLTLAELRALERQSQVTKHNCIQGWSYVAEWTGVPLRTILDRCRPLPTARYVLVRAYDDKQESEPDPEGPGTYYDTLPLELARRPQTLLAYELNGEPLPVEHGAPLRLRAESQLGFKMVKWVHSIELVEAYAGVGAGQGGWREDTQYYSPEAEI